MLRRIKIALDLHTQIIHALGEPVVDGRQIVSENGQEAQQDPPRMNITIARRRMRKIITFRKILLLVAQARTVPFRILWI